MIPLPPLKLFTEAKRVRVILHCLKFSHSFAIANSISEVCGRESFFFFFLVFLWTSADYSKGMPPYKWSPLYEYDPVVMHQPLPMLDLLNGNRLVTLDSNAVLIFSVYWSAKFKYLNSILLLLCPLFIFYKLWKCCWHLEWNKEDPFWFFE